MRADSPSHDVPMAIAATPGGLARSASPIALAGGAAQFVALIGIFLMHPVLVAEAVGASHEVALSMVSLTLVALAAGTLLQAFVAGPIGSGAFCPPAPSVVFLVASLTVARTGNLGMVFGMTMVAGLLQVAFAGAVQRLRPVFTTEIAGIVVTLLGVSIGIIGLRTLTDIPGGTDAVGRGLAVALGSLAVMVVCAVWVPRIGRPSCVGLGMVVGYLLAWLFDVPFLPQAARYGEAPLFALPSFAHVGFDFAWEWWPTCIMVALAATLKTAGNLTALQHGADPRWQRADLRAIRGGVLADGLSAVLAGGIGAHGVSTSTPATGLSLGSGLRGRGIALAAAVLMLLLACSPKLASLLWLMPRPVAIAALVFCGAFMAVSGLRLMTFRMIDARRGIVIGMGLMTGLAVDLNPALVKALPPAMHSLVGSSLVFGSLVALALTLLFRVRATRRSVLLIHPGMVDTRAVDDFMTLQGAAWGARHEVVTRASAAIAQAAETLVAHAVATGPIAVSATFDEFNLDVRIGHDGAPLEFPVARPTNDEIADDPAGERRLAGYLIRRLADRVESRPEASRATMVLHFEH